MKGHIKNAQPVAGRPAPSVPGLPFPFQLNVPFDPSPLKYICIRVNYFTLALPLVSQRLEQWPQ